MKEAKIIAGESQSQCLVTTITVLEVSEPSLYSQMPIKGEYSGNELVLTSFAQIAKNIEKQLEIVSILHQHNQLGIVLYYVGLIMPDVSEKLIEKMNELNMVLILMPVNRIDLRYSEVISEALSYINEEENELEPHLDILIETIRHLPPPNQIETALSILSDKFKCSLFIKSREEEVLLSKTWPRSLDQSLREIIAEKNTAMGVKNSPIEFNQIYYFQTDVHLNLTAVENQYYLTIFKKEPLAEKQLEGIKTIIEKTIKYFGEEQLLNTGQQFFSACQTGDYHTADLLAQKEGVDGSRPLRLYCFERQTAKRNERNIQLKGIYYKERNLEWVIGNVSEEVPYAAFSLNDLPSEYVFISGEFMGLSSVSSQMNYIETQIEDSKRVFPRKHYFYPEDLYLLQDVTQETASIFLDRYLEEELIDTLAAFFLDCNENINDTAHLLFLHNNTIKYRLKRAQERLGLSFSHTASRYLLIKNLIYYRKYK
ncbi:hypothetical protein RV13_GL001864 [Enterococcus raffinosus]|nr:hypothetical protein RV13_GL001864 [Enterococcus raffinosus]